MRRLFCIAGATALLVGLAQSAGAGAKAHNTSSAAKAGLQQSAPASSRSFARTKPPRAHAGQNPAQAARAQSWR